MRYEEHCQRSLDLLGSRHEAVHEYLDQYAQRWGGPSGLHRVLLHHALGLELAVATLGEGARQPAEQHILDDLGRIPSGPDEPHLVLTSWYPRSAAEGRAVLAELRRLFGRDFGLPPRWSQEA